VSLGRYVPRPSPLHALDARAKLVACVCCAGASVLSSRVAGQVLLLAVLLAAFALSRLPWRLLGRAARGAAWLLLFVALANGAWYAVTRQAGWAAGESSVQTLGGLAVLLARLANLLLLAALFTATTVPVDAAEGLERLLRPLARLRLPVHEIGMLLVLSLSFIPIFLREARHLADAHRTKVGLRRWRWRDRVRAVVPLLVPLFLSVLRRADELGVALDARCFEPGARRTSLVPGRFGGAEVAVVTAGVLALAGSAWP
jgi:energy-coupling factor transport system permease protein